MRFPRCAAAWFNQEMSMVQVGRARLSDIARRVDRLSPYHGDHERFVMERDELSKELHAIARGPDGDTTIAELIGRQCRPSHRT
jgi:hypothetical protein